MDKTINFDDFLTTLPQAKKAGKNILGLCVFHDDSSPSLLIFPDGWWQCLGCGRFGRWQSLWNRIKGQPVQIKPERNTQWNGPDVRGMDMEELCFQAHEDLMEFDNFRWYMQMRGLEDRIETHEIGYWKGWYSIPVRDKEYNFVTAVFRAAPHVQQVTGMRYWSRGLPTMFVPDWNLLDQFKYIFVVFGMFDALALNSLRLPVVTSSYGNRTFGANWLDDYRKPIYIIPDLHEEEVAAKLASQLGWRSKVIHLTYPEEAKDPADFFAQNKKQELMSQLSKYGGT